MSIISSQLLFIVSFAGLCYWRRAFDRLVFIDGLSMTVLPE